MAVAKLWRNIPEYYNLIGKKCTACNELFFPGRDVCNKCGSIKLKDHKFIGEGEIVTFTVIRTAGSDPDSIEMPMRNIPYVLAIIRLDEGPMLTAEVVDCNLDEVKIGKRVSVVFRKISEKGERGLIQYGYKFKLE